MARRNNTGKQLRWKAPARPGAHAEEALITAILRGAYPPGSALPAERELAGRLGVTRPTLRETLQRLDRDGWVTIRHGKATRVRDYWVEGGMNVLSAMVRYNSPSLPPDFVPCLLSLRLLIAPAYTREAVQHAAARLAALLGRAESLADTPEAFAEFDWRLQHSLTMASGNHVYTLLLNGFAGFYEKMALVYFAAAETRAASREYYRLLLEAVRKRKPQAAESLTRRVMQRSIALWKKQMGKKKQRAMSNEQ